jgi:Tol biopolymer transport system component
MQHLTGGIRIGILSLDSQAFREVTTVSPPDFANYARLSPGGDLLAYRVESSREEKAGIYVAQIQTGSQTRISGGKNDKLVGWVPGTDKVVFLSDRTGVAGLWSVEFAGGKPAGDPELVRANVGNISPIGITRSGAIYYTEQSSAVDVYLAAVDVETGKVLSPPKRATDRLPGKNTWPMWSHDGQKLGFIRLPPDGSARGASFSVLTLSTGEQRDFSLAGNFTSAIRQTDWSHDESFLLLQSTDVNGRRGIHKLILESGESEPLLTRNPGGEPDNDWNSNPRISPDGKSLYYDRRKFTYEGNKENWSDYIFRRHLGTGQEGLVYHSPESLNIWADPTEISPDGKELATMTAEQDVKRPTKPEAIKIVPLGGGEARTLVTVPPPVHLRWARWTPDGKRIVFLKEEKENVKEMWSIASAGGTPTRIELQLPSLFGFSLHPDGRQIALQATTEGKPEAWVMENVLRGRGAAAK